MLEREPSAASAQSARTMADPKSGGAAKRPAPRMDRNGRTPGGEEAEAFDIWLQRGLHQLYDSVAKEPIPDELLRLIEQDRSDRDK